MRTVALLCLALACGCGRSEPTPTCEQTGVDLLTIDFEQLDDRILLVGNMDVRSNDDAHSGSMHAEVNGSPDGALRTVTPLSFSRGRAVLSFWLRRGGDSDPLAVRVSTDGGSTWRDSTSPLPDANTSRESWTYAEARFEGVDAPALFELFVPAQRTTSDLYIDDVSLHDPDACQPATGVACPWTDLMIYSTHFESDEPQVTVSGGWDITGVGGVRGARTENDGTVRALSAVQITGRYATVRLEVWNDPGMLGTLTARLIGDDDTAYASSDPALNLSNGRTIVFSDFRVLLPTAGMRIRAEVEAAGLGTGTDALGMEMITVIDSDPCGLRP